METNETWTGSDPTEWRDSVIHCEIHPHVKLQYTVESTHRAVYCSACREVEYAGVRYKAAGEIVKTWVSVARDGNLYIEGQRPDNGDWRLVQVLQENTIFTITPVLDETGTPRIRVIREPDDEA